MRIEQQEQVQYKQGNLASDHKFLVPEDEGKCEFVRFIVVYIFIVVISRGQQFNVFFLYIFFRFWCTLRLS